jgi:RimJ/RimL family protein N-acetyltransferase
MSVTVHLTREQMPQILRHLLTLSEEDRRLRFGRNMHERALKSYVKGIDFFVDKAFGVFNSEMKLIAFAHLALYRPEGFAELGLSVSPDDRRQGLGDVLLRRAALHASNLGLRVIYMHCLSENEGMMRLAQKAGFKIVPEGIETDASKSVEQSTLKSTSQEVLCDQIALVDSIFRRQLNILRRMSTLRKFFSRLRRSNPAAKVRRAPQY